MAHKTLISGTAYSVTGGRELIGGTGYAKKKGRVLVNGTGYDIPFSSGITLSTVALGDILMLNENGSPVPFYVCKHDYESGLNGAGRTLLVRKDCYNMRAFSSNNNAFSGSSMDTWLNNTWLKLLDADIQAAVSTTKFYCIAGNGSSTKQTLTRAVFLLSTTELGKGSYNDGTALASAVCSQLAIAYRNGSAVTQWTRTPRGLDTSLVYFLRTNSSLGSEFCDKSQGSRPAFTLPGTFPVIQNPDGTYSPAA
ncbi:MAG: DUF6273 domain-containing protein [Clostridiales bacterium]|nr:DUF6273 domain-containing protein [Clostridiales bacterium]